MSDILFRKLIQSMRPYQWYKNLVIFVGIIFSFNLFSSEMWQRSLFDFIMFCLISGSVYIINDIKDVEKDRLHPTKRFRPIASGTLSSRTALMVSIFLIIISLLASFFVNSSLGYIELIYIFINFAYTFYLKYYAIIDAITIAFGFVLRAISGVIVINASISPWLVLCVFLIALVLAFGKRQNELLIANESRDCLCQYTEKMIESLLNISVSMLLISYSLYSFFVHVYMMITLPFAFYGIFRFVQLVYLNDFGGDAGLILKDRASTANLVLWTVSVILVLYEVHA